MYHFSGYKNNSVMRGLYNNERLSKAIFFLHRPKNEEYTDLTLITLRTAIRVFMYFCFA